MNDVTLETAASSAAFQRPKVIAAFPGYSPPFDPVPIVEKMLESIPPKYLVGLSEVVLTNSSGLSRKLRRSVTKSRNRKVRIVEARGLYRQAWNGKPAWVQIFVDNTLKHWEKSWWLRVPIMRDMLLGEVLFHEIGHHIHFTQRPEYKEREDVADDWKDKLQKNFLRTQYPWLKIISSAFHPLLKRYVKSKAEKLFKSGTISQAEYEKTMKGW